MVWIELKGGVFYHENKPSILYQQCISSDKIKMVRLDTIKLRRNEMGEHYKPCPICYPKSK